MINSRPTVGLWTGSTQHLVEFLDPHANDTPLSGTGRLTATVVILSQIAKAARPSIVVCSGNAHLLPGCAAVEQGTRVTAPCSVFLNERMMTGRRYQNSGSCASSGKSHH